MCEIKEKVLKTNLSLSEMIRRFNKEELKRISSELIEAYRAKNKKLLYLYAKKVQIDPSKYDGHISQLFKKLIFAYHPDRIHYFHQRIMDMHKKGNFYSLQKLNSEITEDLSRYIMPEVEEQYSCSWEEGVEDYLDGDWTGTTEPEDYGFIEAVKNMMYGNLFADFLPKDLFYLDGMLDLSEEGIEDLKGIEYCSNITGLNLEGNQISNLYPIENLTNLDSLYLSRNRIEYIDALGGLTGIKTLDLSFNEIEDVSVLNQLPCLEYVNLVGNKGLYIAPVEILKNRCIVVV